jgi:hypothetical protein
MRGLNHRPLANPRMVAAVGTRKIIAIWTSRRFG